MFGVYCFVSGEDATVTKLMAVYSYSLKRCGGHHHSDPGQLVISVGECAVILKVQEEAVSHDPWILHLQVQVLKSSNTKHNSWPRFN